MSRTPTTEQNNVIQNVKDNILLLASAGTGKTFTIANRIKRILELKLAEPEEIVCLTFTVKACNELKHDLFEYVGEDSKNIHIQTIHSFCFDIIKEEDKRNDNHYIDVMVCDDADEESYLREIVNNNYYKWSINKFLKEKGVSASADALSKMDICFPKNSDHFYWKIPLKRGNLLLDYSGHYGWYNQIAQYGEEPWFACPICKKTVLQGNNICNNCGTDLRSYFPPKSFDIFDNKKTAMYSAVSLLKRHRFLSGNQFESYSELINAIKDTNEYKSVFKYYKKKAGYITDTEFNCFLSEYCDILLEEYSSFLRSRNLVDYDDLIGKAKEYLSDKDVRQRWKNRYKYLIVDEVQDTSQLEYSLLQYFFPQSNIMFCGDVTQTIYKWRGSAPFSILKKYVNATTPKICYLTANYRATKILTNASFGFIKNAFPNYIGKIIPSKLIINSKEEGHKIQNVRCATLYVEAYRIFAYLKAMNLAPSEMCVMARSNSYIAKLYKELKKINDKGELGSLDFFTVDETEQFFKRAIIKDALAFLKIAVNPYDLASVERLALQYVPNVGEKKIEKIRTFNKYGVNLCSFIDEKIYALGDPYQPLINGLKSNRIVIFDTETTGLDLDNDQIIQLSAVKIDINGKIIDTFEKYIIPTVKIKPEALAVSHIDMNTIIRNNGVSASTALKLFGKFVEGCVLVGHNSFSFDSPLIKRELDENNLPPLPIECEYDTLIIAKQFYPDLKNYRLTPTLCEKFNIVNEDAHNASSDVAATGKVLYAMIKQSIVPTETKRRLIVEKYKDEFMTFHKFVQKLKNLIECNDLNSLLNTIYNEALQQKYPDDNASFKEMVAALSVDDKNTYWSIINYIHLATFSTSQMDVLIKKYNKIPIITVHQSKGCEFNTVVVAGCDQNNFPSFAAVSNDPNAEEEEKHVFYVAISRAKENLVLTSCTSNNGYDLKQSPYISLIPSQYVENVLAPKAYQTKMGSATLTQTKIISTIPIQKHPLLSERPSATDEEIIESIEYDNYSYNSLSDDLKKSIIYCAYVINNFPEHRGEAYYLIATALHKYDEKAREQQTEIDERNGEEFRFYSWSDVSKELEAICILANINSRNINLLIKNLLSISAKEGSISATAALIDTYLNIYPYENYDGDYNVDYPWFDIMCMEPSFDSFEYDEDYIVEQDHFRNIKEIDNRTKVFYAEKGLNLLLKNRQHLVENGSPITWYYYAIEDALGKDFYKTELPFIKQEADNGKPLMIELLLDYYEKYEPDNYWTSLIKFGGTGDYKSQCKIAQSYENKFNNGHDIQDFEEAAKWYELIISNKARNFDSNPIYDYKRMLEKYDARKYADKIEELQKEIRVCANEWDYRYSHI